MLDKIEIVIKQIEIVMRGGGANQGFDSATLSKHSYEIFHYYSAFEMGGELAISDEERTSKFLPVAVKLHNKARSLIAPTHTEVWSVLKATSAWMLSIYGEKTPKVYCIVIRLLCKAGQELNILYGKHDAALKCCSSAIQLWNSVNSAIHRSLPPVELQDIKIGVFWAHIEKANILDMLEGKGDDIRKAVSGAMEIMQMLPVQIKYSFAENVSKLGYSATKSETKMLDAIHYFKMALNAIESALLTTSHGNSFASEGNVDESREAIAQKENAIKEVRLKTQLALSFAYMETNQCDKALSCIHALQSASKDSTGPYERMAHTIMFAKHKIALKDRDFPSAETSLRALLKLPLTTFDTALNAVKCYMDEVLNEGVDMGKDATDDGVEFYKMLAAKYPRDPEYTVIRINRLQSLLANMKHVSDAEIVDPGGKALELIRTIISDHISGERLLSDENYAELRKILTSRLRWHRNMSEWEPVVTWCDALQDLYSIQRSNEAVLCTSTGLEEMRDNLSLIKTDALLATGRFEEALRLAQTLVNKRRSTTTIIMMFRAVLLARKPSSLAVKTLRELQRMGLVGDENTASAPLECLSRITLCCTITQECVELSVQDRDITIGLLLRDWLAHYVSIKAWRFSDRRNGGDEMSVVISGDDDDDSKHDDTYFSILCNVCDLFLRSALTRSIFTTNGSNKDHQKKPKKVVADVPSSVKPTHQPHDRTILTVNSTEVVEVKLSHETAVVEPVTSSRCSPCDEAKQEDVLMSSQLVVKYLRPDTADSMYSGMGELVADVHMHHEELAGDDRDVETAPECEMDIDLTIQQVDSTEKDQKEEEGIVVQYDECCTQPQTAFTQHHCSPILEEECGENDEECSTVDKAAHVVDSNVSLAVCSQDSVQSTVTQQEDFFSVFGYPDCLQEEASFRGPVGDKWQYVFRCRVEELYTELCLPLEVLVSVVNAVSSDNLPLLTLGKEEDLVFLVELASNMGSLLFLNNRCVIKPASTDSVSASVSVVSEKFILSAKFFEVADVLYDKLAKLRFEERHVVESDDNDAKKQCACLNAAVAVRIDAENAVTKEQTSSEMSNRESPLTCSSTAPRSLSPVPTISPNLNQALVDACKAEQMVRRHVDFEDRDWRLLRKNALLLQFQILTQMSDVARCEQFIASHQQDMLSLSALELMQCAVIAKIDRSGSIELTRSLLTLALQVCNRDVQPNYAVMGNLYRQLIELSPSRQLALERVEEFEQLTQSLRRTQQRSVDDVDHIAPQFDQSDVDTIVSLAYNYGVSLAELDQVSLAEKFLAKAISLLQHASSALNSWLGKMQDTYAIVLKTKADNSNRNCTSKMIGLDADDFAVVSGGAKSKTAMYGGGKDVALNLDML